MYLETCFTRRTNYTEEGKCESLACHLGAGSIAERWYDELEISAPKITNSWVTLRKHFCVKWLGASPKILLETPKINPSIMNTATTTLCERATHKCDDASRHLLPPTTSSQPSVYAPTIPKPDPITPNPIQTTTKPSANETKPKKAMTTTSSMVTNMNMVTPDETEGKVSGEGRKEEEKVRTVFEDTKEEETGERETGGEVEAKT